MLSHDFEATAMTIQAINVNEQSAAPVHLQNATKQPEFTSTPFSVFLLQSNQTRPIPTINQSSPLFPLPDGLPPLLEEVPPPRTASKHALHDTPFLHASYIAEVRAHIRDAVDLVLEG